MPCELLETVYHLAKLNSVVSGVPLVTAGSQPSQRREVIRAAAPAAPPAPNVVYHKEYPLSREHTLSVSHGCCALILLGPSLPGACQWLAKACCTWSLASAAGMPPILASRNSCPPGLQVSVSEEGGAQVIRLLTVLPGKLLLHWGVQKSDNEAWALPEESSRPEGTLVYKSRALQTPWR